LVPGTEREGAGGKNSTNTVNKIKNKEKQTTGRVLNADLPGGHFKHEFLPERG
jgi:hypothetical protein